MTTLRERLGGISGVPVTAYDGYGEIDHATTVEVYARCARAGIHNLVAAGNTGEFYALTPDEILQVYDAAIEGAAGQAPVTAAVGRSLREAVAMSRAAAKMGAQAVMSHQPVDPFAAPRAQIDYFRKLADESELPVVAYVRADGFSVEDMRLLGGHANIAAVKFATHDVQLLARAVAESDPAGALWVCGLAESWAPIFAAAGATGFTSGLVNVAPHFSLEVLAALNAGDYTAARRVMTRIEPFERMRTLFRNGANVTVVKESVEMLGLRVGPVREPGLPRLSDAHRAELRGILTGWGLTLTA